jgi:hypothetical protein
MHALISKFKNLINRLTTHPGPHTAKEITELRRAALQEDALQERQIMRVKLSQGLGYISEGV